MRSGRRSRTSYRRSTELIDDLSNFSSLSSVSNDTQLIIDPFQTTQEQLPSEASNETFTYSIIVNKSRRKSVNTVSFSETVQEEFMECSNDYIISEPEVEMLPNASKSSTPKPTVKSKSKICITKIDRMPATALEPTSTSDINQSVNSVSSNKLKKVPAGSFAVLKLIEILEDHKND